MQQTLRVRARRASSRYDEAMPACVARVPMRYKIQMSARYVARSCAACRAPTLTSSAMFAALQQYVRRKDYAPRMQRAVPVCFADFATPLCRCMPRADDDMII